ncbi:hypothetical protein D3C85_1321700 [compost metagenome]
MLQQIDICAPAIAQWRVDFLDKCIIRGASCLNHQKPIALQGIPALGRLHLQRQACRSGGAIIQNNIIAYPVVLRHGIQLHGAVLAHKAVGRHASAHGLPGGRIRRREINATSERQVANGAEIIAGRRIPGVRQQIPAA